MASKIFFDANILLDLTLKRSNYDNSRLIMELAVDHKIEAYTSTSILHILGHYLTKAYGYSHAKELMLSLLVTLTIIDITHETAVMALSSNITDIEDALQYYTAIHHKLNYFISGDKQLQKSSIPALPVFTAQEFLKVFL